MYKIDRRGGGPKIVYYKDRPERFLDPPLPTQPPNPILLILFLTKKRFPVNYQKGIFIKVLDIF